MAIAASVEVAAILLVMLLTISTAIARSGEYTVPSETIEQVFHRLSTEPLDEFVEELPRIPKILGYEERDGQIFPRNLTIGMYAKKWVCIIYLYLRIYNHYI